jgi:hypothetical protein
MRYGRVFCAGVLVAVCCASCGPRVAEVSRDTRLTSPETLLHLVSEQENRLSSFTARGSITFDSPEGSGSAFVQVALRKPDSLLVRFRGPFGIEAGMLFLSRTSFLFYNPFANAVYTGSPDARTIRSVIPFDLTPEEILSAFSGHFQIQSGGRSPRRYEVEDDLFRVGFECGEDSCEYLIDPEVFLVASLERWDRSGALIMSAEASEFADREGVNVPRRISVTFPAAHRSLAIFYDQMTVNPETISFSYAIPAGARQIAR